MRTTLKKAKKRKAKHTRRRIHANDLLASIGGKSLFPDKVKNAARILKESPFPEELLGE